MKTLKQVPIEAVEVEFIPNKLEFGILYYSQKFEVSQHLCLCGCGHPCALLITEEKWSLTINNHKPTVTPSILQKFNCKSHYIITNGVANFV